MEEKKLDSTRDLPFKTFVEGFEDIRNIIDGLQEFKYMYHTVPVASCELDTFPGYEEYTKASPVSIERMNDQIMKYFDSLSYAIKCIKSDCVHVENLIVYHKKRLHKEYIRSKYHYRSKMIRERRETNYNIEMDVKKMTGL